MMTFRYDEKTRFSLFIWLIENVHKYKQANSSVLQNRFNLIYGSCKEQL